MKRERIERLAIDVAANELNEDAEALFSAYLGEHPKAKKWAEQMLTTFEQTQAAIAEKTSWANMTGGTAFVGRKPAGRVKWRSVGRWAAAVTFGILVGFVGGRWGTTDETTGISLTERAWEPTPVKSISDLKEKYAGTFWGDKILALLEHKPAEQYGADLHNVSLWDRYRLYKKEKHHE